MFFSRYTNIEYPPKFWYVAHLLYPRHKTYPDFKSPNSLNHNNQLKTACLHLNNIFCAFALCLAVRPRNTTKRAPDINKWQNDATHMEMGPILTSINAGNIKMTKNLNHFTINLPLYSLGYMILWSRGEHKAWCLTVKEGKVSSLFFLFFLCTNSLYLLLYNQLNLIQSDNHNRIVILIKMILNFISTFAQANTQPCDSAMPIRGAETRSLLWFVLLMLLFNWSSPR